MRSATQHRMWALGVALLLMACGDRERPAAAGGETGAPPADAGAAAPAPAGGGAVPAEPTQEMIARGNEIFHGKAANGICYTCHGQNGEGGQLAPNLTDAEWLNTDGSMQGLVEVIRTGVMQPKKFPAPMPPMGGADLNQEDLTAVAGYVYSLSH